MLERNSLLRGKHQVDRKLSEIEESFPELKQQQPQPQPQQQQQQQQHSLAPFVRKFEQWNESISMVIVISTFCEEIISKQNF